MPPIIDPDRVFFNKWEMHKIFETQEFRNHFKQPDTATLTLESLHDMVVKHSSIYIKPISTWGGKDISKIEHNAESICWQLQGHTPQFFSSIDDVFTSLVNHYGNVTCIVQQEAPLLKLDNRPFDIRTHLQHDLSNGWIYAGDLIRIGGEGSIVSNVNISHGSVQPASILSTMFENSEEIAVKLKTTSMVICHTLDNHHPFLEVGIDFGIDKTGELWLIEVNTNDALGGPDQKLFEMLPDKSVYKRMEKQGEMINEQLVHLLFDSFKEYLKIEHNKQI